MKKVINSFIPFKGFLAITIWPFIFIRKEYKNLFNEIVENHENIHGKQQKELLLIFFYLWYIIEYLVRLIIYLNRKKAYRNISFEQEAFSNESDFKYIENRKMYSFIRYFKNN